MCVRPPQHTASFSRLRKLKVDLDMMNKKIIPPPNAFRPSQVTMETVKPQTCAADTELLTEDVSRYRDTSSSTLPRLQRELGPIETMYHRYILRGIDMVSFMLTFLSKEPITLLQMKCALRCLMQRHPLLRMTVRRDQQFGNTVFKFVEMEKPEVVLGATSDTNWRRVMQEEINRRVDSVKGPLWRCTIIEKDRTGTLRDSCNIPHGSIKNCPDNSLSGSGESDYSDISLDLPDGQLGQYRYQPCFILTWHHSIIDGGYISWIIRDFVIFLDAAVSDHQLKPSGIKPLPLMPSIEDVLVAPFTSLEQFCDRSPLGDPQYSNPRYSIVQWKEKQPCRDMLNRYNEKYAEEIRNLSRNTASNTHIPIEFNQQQTLEIMARCKQNDVSVNGVIWAASVSSMVDMLYSGEELPLTLTIPFEFVLDLRKHFRLNAISDPGFAGVASTSVSMAAKCSFRHVPIGHLEFWEIAKSFNSGIKREAKSLDISELIEGVREENKVGFVPEKVGKSPFILCVSNIGVLDFLVPPDVSERLKLTGIHGNSSILVDDMPIFLIGTHSLEGRLCCSISYCANYTSTNTAEEFSRRFHMYLSNGSKL